MDESEMRFRPGFLLGILVAFVILAGLMAFLEMDAEKIRTKARIVATRGEERWMANLLVERALQTGGLTNIDREFVLNSLTTTNPQGFRFTPRTNLLGETIDFWKTPYRIQLAGQTNFIIHSAGRDRKFGNEDDIIFDSTSNIFVKP
jgi:hypothetical protein